MFFPDVIFSPNNPFYNFFLFFATRTPTLSKNQNLRVWNNSDNKGRTVLHYAAANSDPAIYNWMMEDEDFKTLADCTDKDGKKPEYYLTHKEL